MCYRESMRQPARLLLQLEWSSMMQPFCRPVLVRESFVRLENEHGAANNRLMG